MDPIYDPNYLATNGKSSYSNLTSPYQVTPEDLTIPDEIGELAYMIETQLQIDATVVTTEHLIFYLSYNSNNEGLDPDNIGKTNEFIKKIIQSYSYENIFSNKSNYSNVTTMYIGLLLPFFYTYPRFYKLNYIGIVIGFGCFFGLVFHIKKLYGPLMPDTRLDIIYICVCVALYFIFFVLCNKLNHLSLFYLTAAAFYSCYNWIIRLIIVNPSNSYCNYRATSKDGDNYQDYNIYIEAACLEFISRNNLNLPSGNILYSYFTEFTIGDAPTEDKDTDFAMNFLCPLISVGIMIWAGSFLLKYNKVLETDVKYKDEFTIKPFPLIGFGFFDNEQTKKYYTCQANYVLPEELNFNMLIHPIISKYKIRDPVWFASIEKALVRITNELLNKYNPKFCRINDTEMNIIEQESVIFKKIKDMIGSEYINKVYTVEDGEEDKEELKKENPIKFLRTTVLELLKKHRDKDKDKGRKDKPQTGTYITLLRQIVADIDEKEMDHKEKKILRDFINHIENGILIINEYNFEYDKDSKEDYILAKNELLYNDLKLKKKFKDKTEEYRKKLIDELSKIIDEYIDAFKKNLSIKGDPLFDKNRLENKQKHIYNENIDQTIYDYIEVNKDSKENPKKTYVTKKIHTVDTNGELTSSDQKYEKKLKKDYDVNKKEEYARYVKSVIKKDLIQTGGDPPDLEENNFNVNKSSVKGIYTVKPVFGYHYNIITHNVFEKIFKMIISPIAAIFTKNSEFFDIDERIKKGSNFLLDICIGVLSVWFVFAKMFGSTWLITKHILLRDNPEKLIKILSRNYDGLSLFPKFLWKYFMCGLDHSYFEDRYKERHKIQLLPKKTLNSDKLPSAPTTQQLPTILSGGKGAINNIYSGTKEVGQKVVSDIGQVGSLIAKPIVKGTKLIAKPIVKGTKVVLKEIGKGAKVTKNIVNNIYSGTTEVGQKIVTDIGQVGSLMATPIVEGTKIVSSTIGEGVNVVSTKIGVGPISNKVSKGTYNIGKLLLSIIYHILIMIMIGGFLYFYNSSMFGLSFKPSWQNMALQGLFIVFLGANTYILSNEKVDRKKNIFWFNIIFLTCINLAMAIMVIVMYFTEGGVEQDTEQYRNRKRKRNFNIFI